MMPIIGKATKTFTKQVITQMKGIGCRSDTLSRSKGFHCKFIDQRDK